MASAGTVVDKTGGKKRQAPPVPVLRSDNSSGGKTGKGGRKQSKKRTVVKYSENGMLVELEEDLVAIDDAPMGGLTQITALLRKLSITLEKGDYLAGLLEWGHHPKSGKAELRVMAEDYLFFVEQPWKFGIHKSTGGLPPKPDDIAPRVDNKEVAQYNENAAIAKMKAMIEENNKMIRDEVHDEGKKNLQAMEKMLGEGIDPLKQEMASLVQGNEETKAGLDDIKKKMKKEKKTAKKNTKMLEALLAAQKIQVSDGDDSDSSAESVRGEKQNEQQIEKKKAGGGGSSFAVAAAGATNVAGAENNEKKQQGLEGNYSNTAYGAGGGGLQGAGQLEEKISGGKVKRAVDEIEGKPGGNHGGAGGVNGANNGLAQGGGVCSGGGADEDGTEPSDGGDNSDHGGEGEGGEDGREVVGGADEAVTEPESKKQSPGPQMSFPPPQMSFPPPLPPIQTLGSGQTLDAAAVSAAAVPRANSVGRHDGHRRVWSRSNHGNVQDNRAWGANGSGQGNHYQGPYRQQHAQAEYYNPYGPVQQQQGSVLLETSPDKSTDVASSVGCSALRRVPDEALAHQSDALEDVADADCNCVQIDDEAYEELSRFVSSSSTGETRTTDTGAQGEGDGEVSDEAAGCLEEWKDGSKNDDEEDKKLHKNEKEIRVLRRVPIFEKHDGKVRNRGREARELFKFSAGAKYCIPTPKTIFGIKVQKEGAEGGGEAESSDASGDTAEPDEAAQIEAVEGGLAAVDAVAVCGDDEDGSYDGGSTTASNGEDDSDIDSTEDQCEEAAVEGATDCVPVHLYGAAPSKGTEAPSAPSRVAKENTKKKRSGDGEDESHEDEDEDAGAPPSKKRKDENPLEGVPIDTIEPLPGRQQLRVTTVNMNGVKIHNEKLNWIVDVAGWRKIDVALLSEFAYKKKTCKAAKRRKRGGRRRRSERDEESSDEEENEEDLVVEHEDPIATKGVPTWVLRSRFDMVYINGCGVMIFNKKLREQAKKIREQHLKHAIRSGPRFLALYLSEVILAATYAPQANAGPDELEGYDSGVVELLREMQKRKKDKWKMRIIGGDINAHVGREEFADSVAHLGVGGALATNGRGRSFAKVLMATNNVLVSSKFDIMGAGDDDGPYHTYKGKAGLGGSEVDHYLAYGPHLSKYRTYRRVDYGAPDVNGKPTARAGGFDHLAVEVLVDVRTRRRLHEEGEARALAAREILQVVDPEVLTSFNEDLKRRVRVAGDEFHLEDFQDFLIEWVDALSGKRSQQPAPEEADPEELEDNGRARSNMWKLFREQKLNERPSSSGKGGITPQKAKEKYDDVGNSPLHPELDELPISPELSELVSELSDEIKQKLERPVEAKELKRAALHLKAGGKARDINGLGADILLKLDSGSLELMTEVVRREVSTRDFHLLGGGLHRCRDVSLFKGKGERSDPDNYRFLVISPLVTKLLVRVMSSRLHDALEEANFFSDTQFGFRAKRGTQDSMLVMNRLREDMKNYRFSSAMRALVVLVDLRKAFPSLDWRLVRGVIQCLGIGRSKLWQILDATHRSAEHTFGEGVFTLAHGCKEGDPSSPLLFIMAFAVVMKRFKNKLDEKRVARGMAEPDGAPLFVRDDVRHLAREDMIIQLGMTERPGRIVEFVLDFLFADDTTLVQRLRADRAREVAERDKQARKEETCLVDLPAVEMFGEVLTECGLRENQSKRVQADVVEITTRNLGMNVNPAEDCKEKIKKAWRAYWTLRSRLSGIGGI
eukprot:g17043.t1